MSETEYPRNLITSGAGYVPSRSPDAAPVGVRESLKRESVVMTAVPEIALGEMPDDGAFASRTVCRSVWFESVPAMPPQIADPPPPPVTHSVS